MAIASCHKRANRQAETPPAGGGAARLFAAAVIDAACGIVRPELAIRLSPAHRVAPHPIATPAIARDPGYQRRLRWRSWYPRSPAAADAGAFASFKPQRGHRTHLCGPSRGKPHRYECDCTQQQESDDERSWIESFDAE